MDYELPSPEEIAEGIDWRMEVCAKLVKKISDAEEKLKSINRIYKDDSRPMIVHLTDRSHLESKQHLIQLTLDEEQLDYLAAMMGNELIALIDEREHHDEIHHYGENAEEEEEQEEATEEE